MLDCYEQIANLKSKQVIADLGQKSADHMNYHDWACLALANALQRRSVEVEKVLARMDIEECDSVTRGIALEASFVLNNNRSITLDRLSDLEKEARDILDLNPKAVYARHMLGLANLMRGYFEEGNEMFMQIQKDYPKANWIYRAEVAYFTRMGMYEQALHIIPDLDKPFYRWAYWFLATTFEKHFFVWLLIIMILISFQPITYVAYLGISLICFSSFVYFVRKRDSLVYRIALVTWGYTTFWFLFVVIYRYLYL